MSSTESTSSDSHFLDTSDGGETNQELSKSSVHTSVESTSSHSVDTSHDGRSATNHKSSKSSASVESTSREIPTENAVKKEDELKGGKKCANADSKKKATTRMNYKDQEHDAGMTAS